VGIITSLVAGSIWLSLGLVSDVREEHQQKKETAEFLLWMEERTLGPLLESGLRREKEKYNSSWDLEHLVEMMRGTQFLDDSASFELHVSLRAYQIPLDDRFLLLESIRKTRRHVNHVVERGNEGVKLQEGNPSGYIRFFFADLDKELSWYSRGAVTEE